MLREMDIRDLKAEFNLNIRGLIQVGSFIAKEYPVLKSIGIQDFIFIEANPNIIKELQSNIDSDCKIFNELIADTDGTEYTFNIANHKQSSSMLKFDKHIDYHPEYSEVIDTITLYSSKLDTLIDREQIDLTKYNCLMMDVQGAEIFVLHGFDKYLDSMDYIYTELNYESMYVNCCLEPEFSKYLDARGFTLCKSFDTGKGWGDGLYIKNELL